MVQVCVLKTCLNCGGKIGVIDTRALEEERVRIRCCRECGRQLETVETAAWVVNEGGTKRRAAQAPGGTPGRPKPGLKAGSTHWDGSR